MSDATVDLAEFTATGYTEWGLRRYGAPFIVWMHEAVVTLERLTSRKRDPASGQQGPGLDPRNALPRILYEALQAAEGHGVTVVESVPVTVAPLKHQPPPLTPRQRLETILEDFLDEVSTARWTGQDLTISARMTLSPTALEYAVASIEAIFDKALPTEMTVDTERLLRLTRIRQLEAEVGMLRGVPTVDVATNAAPLAASAPAYEPRRRAAAK